MLGRVSHTVLSLSWSSFPCCHTTQHWKVSAHGKEIEPDRFLLLLTLNQHLWLETEPVLCGVKFHSLYSQYVLVCQKAFQGVVGALRFIVLWDPCGSKINGCSWTAYRGHQRWRLCIVPAQGARFPDSGVCKDRVWGLSLGCKYCH